jgi:hypothetical protein
VLQLESSLCFLASDYEKEEKVLRPDEVTLQPQDNAINLALPLKLERPTLYSLSNFAFPLRWIDRQGPWAKKAELEEDRSERCGRFKLVVPIWAQEAQRNEITEFISAPV